MREEFGGGLAAQAGQGARAGAVQFLGGGEAVVLPLGDGDVGPVGGRPGEQAAGRASAARTSPRR
ncbi:hypothetical protein ACFQY7_44235 [Actinomadura luteofluorescens]|uniref:hypothetical protein n=1 Tax=Actinomadura luteofluorescens TaxID=46163 RepID=UPI00362571F5